MGKWVIGLRAFLTFAVVASLAGCGGDAKPLVRVVGEGLDEAPNVRQMADDLQRLDREGDNVDVALGNAFCDGVTTVAQDGELPDGEDWAGFLQGRIEDQVFEVSPGVIGDKVEEFEAAANLAQVNPGLAVRYAQACGPRF